jgi:predicted DCC family thiol-disulfide oxidoreductase YuxK
LDVYALDIDLIGHMNPQVEAGLMQSAHDHADDFEIEVFYDGECPLCLREIRMLGRRDRRRRIRFTDIAAEGFDAAKVGVSWQALMDRIHGRLPDGTLVEGVEVFRRLYSAVGFGPLVAITRLPGIAQLLDVVNHALAEKRLRLTGRCVDGACEICVLGAGAQEPSAAPSSASQTSLRRMNHGIHGGS